MVREGASHGGWGTHYKKHRAHGALEATRHGITNWFKIGKGVMSRLDIVTLLL